MYIWLHAQKYQKLKIKSISLYFVSGKYFCFFKVGGSATLSEEWQEEAFACFV